MPGSPCYGDGCHCSEAGIEAMATHVGALMAEIGADFLMTDSCIVAIRADGSSKCFHHKELSTTPFHQIISKNGPPLLSLRRVLTLAGKEI